MKISGLGVLMVIVAVIVYFVEPYMSLILVLTGFELFVAGLLLEDI